MEYYIELAQNRYKVELKNNRVAVTHLNLNKAGTFDLGTRYEFDKISVFFSFLLIGELTLDGNDVNRENLTQALPALKGICNELGQIHAMEW